jgi:hypothetical protein
MAQTTDDRIGAVVMSGPREGEVVLLDPEVVLQAPSADDVDALAVLNTALDSLNTALDRFIAAVKTSADDYASAAERLERAE